jgi:hypothetical protein
MNPRVKEVYYQSPYKLMLTFNNNEIRQFDLTPYLNYSIYKPLADESFCKKAKVFLGTVAWNDEIDFDPDTLFLESVTIHS